MWSVNWTLCSALKVNIIYKGFGRYGELWSYKIVDNKYVLGGNSIGGALRRRFIFLIGTYLWL